MRITIRYFASLRDEIGRSEDQPDLEDGMTIASAWQKLHGGDMPDRILAAVNQEYASPDHVLKEGDEVAFFPPVTGG